MIQNEGNGFGIESDIQRVQHRAQHRHTVMGLQHLRCVGAHDRDTVPGADSLGGERIGKF